MVWLSGWRKRKAIRYGSVFPSANLSDYPKLLDVAADADLATELATGGGIAITGPDGQTALPLGLYPSTNLAAGRVLLRFQTNLLTAAQTGDVLGYLYYDRGQVTTEDKSGVVSNGFALFMPLEENPSLVAPQMLDWVSESNIGASSGGMTDTDSVSGQVGQALDFDGGNDYVDVGDRPAFDFERTDQLSISAFIKHMDADLSVIVAKQDVATVFRGYDFFKAGGDTLALNLVNNFSTGNLLRVDSTNVAGLDDNGRHHVAATYTGGSSPSDIKLYVDGVSVSTVTVSDNLTDTILNNVGLRIAGRQTNNIPFNGLIDEVRVASVARSDDWIRYEHTDEANNSETFTLGQSENPPWGPEITGPTGHLRFLVNTALSLTKTCARSLISVWATGSPSPLAGCQVRFLTNPNPPNSDSALGDVALADLESSDTNITWRTARNLDGGRAAVTASIDAIAGAEPTQETLYGVALVNAAGSTLLAWSMFPSPVPVGLPGDGLHLDLVIPIPFTCTTGLK